MIQRTPGQGLSLAAGRLSQARWVTDQLFDSVQGGALYERPIPERHRLVFYLGHLEVFDWNMIGRESFGLDSRNPTFDKLFEFGIDPVNGALPPDTAKDWPGIPEIRKYNQIVRAAVDRCIEAADNDGLGRPYMEEGLIVWAAIEHRLMHAETLAYMLHWLAFEHKAGLPEAIESNLDPPAPREVTIPAGAATLGVPRNAGPVFAWDNEYSQITVDVPEFSIDVYNVTNAQYLEFMLDGGYETQSLWTADAWKWLTANGIRHPKFWRGEGNRWLYRTMRSEVPLPLAWPVYVSHAEASAYARWRGKSLPTESQYDRAAFGAPGGKERTYPWGDAPPQRQMGNFDFQDSNPSRVDAHPAGNSAFGVADLMGNGWEWTSTLFEPFPGFEAFPFYPGYSADFFDGKHFVMKGASPRTSSILLRRSFRNWFQAHYPNVYATFRCVKN